MNISNNIKNGMKIFIIFNRLDENEKDIKYNKLLKLYKNRDMENLKKEVVKEIPQIIFKDVNSLQPFESFKHVYSRFLDFKNYLISNHKDTLEDSNQKVIIITHGDFLGIITNKYLYESDNVNYFPKECFYCKNCDIISIYI